VRERWDDLTARWAYHPTFKASAVADSFLPTLVTVGGRALNGSTTYAFGRHRCCAANPTDNETGARYSASVLAACREPRR
jgi:hypothetical protein